MENNIYLEKIREVLIDRLSKYNGTNKISFEFSCNTLNSIVFEYNIEKTKREMKIPFDLLKKIDMSFLFFNHVDIKGLDFTGCSGAVINPMLVYERDLSNSNLCDVNIIGSMNGVKVMGTSFKGCSNAVIDPQMVFNKNLSYTKLDGVYICGSFNDVNVEYANFSGSSGAIIDPVKVFNRSLKGCVLKDTIIKGDLNNVMMAYTDFTGSKGAVVDLDKLDYMRAFYANLTDATIIGNYRKCSCVDALPTYFGIRLDEYPKYRNDIYSFDNYKSLVKSIDSSFKK